MEAVSISSGEDTPPPPPVEEKKPILKKRPLPKNSLNRFTNSKEAALELDGSDEEDEVVEVGGEEPRPKIRKTAPSKKMVKKEVVKKEAVKKDLERSISDGLSDPSESATRNRAPISLAQVRSATREKLDNILRLQKLQKPTRQNVQEFVRWATSPAVKCSSGGLIEEITHKMEDKVIESKIALWNVVHGLLSSGEPYVKHFQPKMVPLMKNHLQVNEMADMFDEYVRIFDAWESRHRNGSFLLNAIWKQMVSIMAHKQMQAIPKKLVQSPSSSWKRQAKEVITPIASKWAQSAQHMVAGLAEGFGGSSTNNDRLSCWVVLDVLSQQKPIYRDKLAPLLAGFLAEHKVLNRPLFFEILQSWVDVGYFPQQHSVVSEILDRRNKGSGEATSSLSIDVDEIVADETRLKWMRSQLKSHQQFVRAQEEHEKTAQKVKEEQKKMVKEEQTPTVRERTFGMGHSNSIGTAKPITSQLGQPAENVPIEPISRFQELAQPQAPMTLEVLTKKAGLIIGKKGQKMKALQEETECRIQLRDNHDGWTTVVIHGPEEGKEKAADHIRAFFPPLVEVQLSQEELAFWNDHRTQEVFQDKTGTHVHVVATGLVLEGTEEECAPLKERILDMVGRSLNYEVAIEDIPAGCTAEEVSASVAAIMGMPVELELEAAGDGQMAVLKLQDAEECSSALHSLDGVLTMQGQRTRVLPRDPPKTVDRPMPYHAPMLLIGEGNFSFARSLCHRLPTAVGIVATTLDPMEELVEKYGSVVRTNTSRCTMRGCVIHFKVDATQMLMDAAVNSMKYRFILFNFPHTLHVQGGLAADEDDMAISVDGNRFLVKTYFKQGRSMLTEDGEMQVTIKDHTVYRRWEIHLLGQSAGLQLFHIFPFSSEDWPGYDHVITRKGVRKQVLFYPTSVLRPLPAPCLSPVCPLWGTHKHTGDAYGAFTGAQRANMQTYQGGGGFVRGQFRGEIFVFPFGTETPPVKFFCANWATSFSLCILSRTFLNTSFFPFFLGMLFWG